jgi:hypothetical protein
VNKSKRRATITGWGLVILGGLSVLVACGSSPDWQNQYTEEPVYTGGGEDSGQGAEPEDAGADCSTPSCNSTLSASPPSTSPPVLTDPQGNPDPVPWAVNSIVPPPKSE